MENTVCDKCTKKSCPNKITTPWKNEKGEIREVVDCAPKRTMIMVQQLSNAVVGVQKSQEEMRNSFDKVRTEMAKSKAPLFDLADVKPFYIEQGDRGQ